jgi:hypothetical protein
MKLPGGKTIDANCGIIGLDEELCVFGGYDDFFRCESDPPRDYQEWRSVDFSRHEAVELADIMIARWQAFKAKNLP